MEAQIAILKEYTAQQGYSCESITTEYGSGITLERPGLMEVMQAAADGKMDALVVKDLSRLARGCPLMAECIQRLNNQGVELISIRDGVRFASGEEHFWA